MPSFEFGDRSMGGIPSLTQGLEKVCRDSVSNAVRNLAPYSLLGLIIQAILTS